MKRFAATMVIAGVCLTAAVTAQNGPRNEGNRGNGNGHGRQAERDALVSELQRIVRGFEIAPVQLDLRGKDLQLVGLGSYLVNAAGGCNDCHTSPPFAEGGDPFLGQPKKVNDENYLAGGVPFGPFTSRNLTPRASNGLPANLTWPQFRLTMRTGQDLKNRHPEMSPLLQVMPWPVYQELSDRDLRAIYEFLRAIPTASAPAPPQS